jgi:hypothetical protein
VSCPPLHLTADGLLDLEVKRLARAGYVAHVSPPPPRRCRALASREVGPTRLPGRGRRVRGGAPLQPVVIGQARRQEGDLRVQQFGQRAVLLPGDLLRRRSASRRACRAASCGIPFGEPLRVGAHRVEPVEVQPLGTNRRDCATARGSFSIRRTCASTLAAVGEFPGIGCAHQLLVRRRAPQGCSSAATPARASVPPLVLDAVDEARRLEHRLDQIAHTSVKSPPSFLTAWATVRKAIDLALVERATEQPLAHRRR